MEIIDLRHFTSADLRPLLQEETEVWSDELAWDYSSSADMILRYVDAAHSAGLCGRRARTTPRLRFLCMRGTKG